MSKGTFCGLSCSCRDVFHLTWAAPSTEASTKPYIRTSDRLSPPQISFPAAGTHRNNITIIDSADRCQRKLCVVCPAPAATSSTSPELLHRQKHPPNQTSWLLTVFRRLRSPSLPPAPTAMASPSSTQQMNLRSTWVHKRGRTLLFLLMLCIA